MNDIIKQNLSLEKFNEEYGIVEMSNDLLSDVSKYTNSNNIVSFPIAEISTLGAGVSSLIPSFNTVTQTTTIATEGLYRIANKMAGDTLKIAKDGNSWGAMKTAAGKSKMIKLAETGPISATTQSVAAFNPATMMMAATLYSIEKDLDDIKETQKHIIDFLQMEKEASIEADVEALTKIVSNYKHTWNNDLQVANNHKTVNDIKIRARGSIKFYIKEINEVLSSKQFITSQDKIQSSYSKLEKMFKYYRLSLYSFSLSTMLEVLLSENRNEGYILEEKAEIDNLANEYREIFNASSLYLEKLGHVGIETNLVKGLASTEKVIGRAIGNIPLIKEGQIDEFLKKSGTNLQNNARNMELKAVKQFAILSNPGTNVFINKLDDMVMIYNHVNHICFDKENVYLIA